MRAGPATCCCGFLGFSAEFPRFDSRWHREHYAAHRGAFPNLDHQGTWEFLLDRIAIAERNERFGIESNAAIGFSAPELAGKAGEAS